MTPTEIVDQLAELRDSVANIEATRHELRVNAFMASHASTLKGMEYEADAATLDLNREILQMRARVRTLEDRLRVELDAEHRHQP